jgi:hypothetical protein
MALKKRQTHDLNRSHKLTLKSAGILLQKKWALRLGFMSYRFAHCKYNTAKII